jgi:Ca2+-binding RTX toxin-like protein
MARRSVSSRRGAIVAATVAAAALALPVSASAEYDFEVEGRVVRIIGDGEADTLIIDEISGRLRHNQFNVSPGFASRTDFDNNIPGDQPVLRNILAVNAGGGDDVVTINSANATLNVDGQGGNDTLTGNDNADALRGGAGNDVLVGARGADDLEGGDGDDTIVWNNGDGSDVVDGDGGSDTIQVNGAPAGDAFTIAPAAAGRVRFDRTNLVPFLLDVGTSEGLELNGLGGDDQFDAQPGTGLTMLVNGDDGNDSLSGGDGPDTLIGGSGSDVLIGGAGTDTLDGQDGDDILDVRDGSFDRASGGAGTDLARTDEPGVDALDGIEILDALGDAGAAPGDAAPGGAGAGDAGAAPGDAAAAPALRVVTRRVKLQRRRGGGYVARIRVSCPAAATDGCQGRLDLLTARAVRVAGTRARVTLGRARYDLDAGQSRTLTLRLPAKVNRYDRRGRLAARARTSTRVAGGRSAQGFASLALTLPNRGR